MPLSNLVDKREHADCSYPTFEQLQELGQKVERSFALRRIHYWTLSPDWEDGILVTEPTASGDLSGHRPLRRYYDRQVRILHKVAQEPISDPKVSAIEVRVSNFENLESEFDAYHWDCLRLYDNYDDEEASIRELLKSEREQVEIPEDYDPNDPNRPSIHGFKRLKCCNLPRPTNYVRSIQVKCSPNGPGYVTVHDYITTIHPWLRDLEAEFMQAYKIQDSVIDEYTAPDEQSPHKFEDHRISAGLDQVSVWREVPPIPVDNIISSLADADEVEEAQRQCEFERQAAMNRLGLKSHRPS